MTLRQVHVEACIKQESVADLEEVREGISKYLRSTSAFFTKGPVLLPDNSSLAPLIERIDITEFDGEVVPPVTEEIPSSSACLIVHVFKLSNEASAEETVNEDESVTTCQLTILPALCLDGLWDSLIFDTSIKRNVLDYVTTAMLFSDSKVNPHIISWNRVVLLHGPPGTGKTSLCKGLAQKLSIRLSDRYPNAVLLEINAHSLFSKWFSESGKLVMKLFRQIRELMEDEDSLVCVLIDEVESLTAARTAVLSRSEPSDAIRVVNALLTQLDSLKRCSNVLVLTTSNIVEAIDAAFVDRADIKQYIGLPSCHARYEILRSCIEELRRVRILQSRSSKTLFLYQELMARRVSRKREIDEMTSLSAAVDISEKDLELSMQLLQVAKLAEGLSGRALRKLPFQAHALYAPVRDVDVGEFLIYLIETIGRETEQKQQLVSNSLTSRE